MIFLIRVCIEEYVLLDLEWVMIFRGLKEKTYRREMKRVPLSENKWCLLGLNIACWPYILWWNNVRVDDFTFFCHVVGQMGGREPLRGLGSWPEPRREADVAQPII
jgi:hypothetical protein